MAHRLGVFILNKPNKRNFIFKVCVFVFPMPKPQPSCCRKARVALDGVRVLHAPVSAAPWRMQRTHFVCLLGQQRMSVAFDQVVVDHAAGLHEGIANGRAYEFETGLFECLTHGV